MKDTKYRFFFGVFVGFILAGFFFFLFFYRSVNAQSRPASPQPRAAASVTYEPPPTYGIVANDTPPNYTIANYAPPAGISPAPVDYLNPARELAPNLAHAYVSQPSEPIARYDSSPEYSYSIKPEGHYAKYLGSEPPPVYSSPGYLYDDPSPIYPVYSS
jgi:hypothetical protein